MWWLVESEREIKIGKEEMMNRKEGKDKLDKAWKLYVKLAGYALDIAHHTNTPTVVEDSRYMQLFCEALNTSERF